MHANYSRGQFRITPSVKKVIGFSEVPKKLAPVVQGGFFDWSALKMTKCQPLKEFSELVLPKND